MVWACFAASGPGQLANIDRTMNSELYQQILKENVRTSVKEESQEKVDHAATQAHKSSYQRMVKEEQS